MNLIRDCLYSEKESSCSTVITGYLDHFESCAFEDVGWGCGWRNIQMLGSHLLTHHWAKEVLFGGVGFVPDIPSLQQWLELAWTCGFDEHGAEFYQFKIHGCREWIGTTECAALFRSFGLRARIVDFSSAVRKLENGQATIDRWFQRKVPESGNAQNKMSVQLPGTNKIHLNVECDACGAYPIKGKRYKSKKKENYDLCSSCILQETKQQDYEELTSCRSASLKQEAVKDENVNHEHLIKWVWDYFIDHVSSPVSKACLDLFQGHIATSGSTPLYFQHQGHSRTIVGVQRRKKHAASNEEVFLLVLDPSNKTEELLQSLRSKRNWQKLIKRGVHTLKKRSYQVCYVEPGIAEGQELQELKILKSEHFYN
ncbi:hypothetical protein KP509_02G063500 [Ceratopteris richardii]|nr:hypothetical protein KP509_02G063500 [Ceratopteris richardii]